MEISIRRRVLRLLSRHILDDDVPFSNLCTTLCLFASYGQISELFPATDLSVDEDFVFRLCETDDNQAIIDVLESAAGVLLSDEAFASLANKVIMGSDDLKILSAVYELAFWRLLHTGKRIVRIRNEVVMKLVNSPSIDDRIVGHRIAIFSDLPISERLSLISSCLKGNKHDKQIAMLVLSICVTNDEWIAEVITQENLSHIMSLLEQTASQKGKAATQAKKSASQMLEILSSHLRNSKSR